MEDSWTRNSRRQTRGVHRIIKLSLFWISIGRCCCLQRKSFSGMRERYGYHFRLQRPLARPGGSVKGNNTEHMWEVRSTRGVKRPRRYTPQSHYAFSVRCRSFLGWAGFNKHCSHTWDLRSFYHQRATVTTIFQADVAGSDRTTMDGMRFSNMLILNSQARSFETNLTPEPLVKRTDLDAFYIILIFPCRGSSLMVR